ncbi:MAG: ABC transporter substrate-binding protein [Clostridiales bacterium]|nr:ABC transporter substrate-binding protein [Clostridiales bacterium]
MKKRYLTILLALIMVVSMVFAACGDSGGGGGGGSSSGGGSGGELVEKGYQSDMDKDAIIVSGVRSITGFNASFEETAFGPYYKMWVDLINQDGGLYVKSLDRKVPVKLGEIVDDQSDETLTQQHYERLCVEGKADWILPPVSTNALKLVVPIAQKYDYLIIGGEGGARELEAFSADFPNFYEILGYSTTQVPAFVKLASELGIESIYIAYVDDSHGIEYTEFLREECGPANIEILGTDALDLFGNFDPSVVVNAAKNSGADAFLLCAYPPQNFPVMATSVALEYNPKAYLVGPGGGYDYIGLAALGDPTNMAVDGMMAWGAWSEKSSPAAAELSNMFKDYWIEKGQFWKDADGNLTGGEVYQDWWGNLGYWSVIQVYQQAVENAGELTDSGQINQATLVEYIKGASFDTVLNPNLRFNNNRLDDEMYAGNITQWQGGKAEVIDADDRRTADPIYPKPAWPKD